MAFRKTSQGSLFTLLLVIVALGLWLREQGGKPADTPQKTERAPVETKAAPPPRQETGGYESFSGCSLVADHSNDGDSFRVRLPDGRSEVFRLYFVDTPESAFKRYRDGETNHERIRHQAADLGGLTPEQAVELGVTAKKFTLGLLSKRRFTLHTAWDSPYRDGRYHAFVRVTDKGLERWLHELLVERGLARIRTKPADLPDGTSAKKQLGKLRELERAARSSEAGAWGM